MLFRSLAYKNHQPPEEVRSEAFFPTELFKDSGQTEKDDLSAQQWRACQDSNLESPATSNARASPADLDRFTHASPSPCDPTATRNTTFRLLSHSCISGERKLTYVVELIERGPNIKPVFPTAARDTLISVPTTTLPSLPCDQPSNYNEHSAANTTTWTSTSKSKE